MKNEFKHFDIKCQLKKKKIVMQVIGNKTRYKRNRKMTEASPFLSAITLDVNGLKSSKTYWQNE